MRVLVLRPEPQANAMAAALAAAGIAAVTAPMLTIVPEADVAARIADGAAAPGALVFTSAAGVAALVADPAHGSLLPLPVVAVGPATAEAARVAGFRRVTDAGGDGAAVVAAALDTLAAVDGPVVHVAGRERAVDVAGALAAAGRAARTVVAYRAEATEEIPPEAAAAIVAGGFDAVVIASARTAGAFGRWLERADVATVPRAVLVAISAKAAAPLRPFFGRLVVADAPDGDSLTKAVVALAPEA